MPAPAYESLGNKRPVCYLIVGHAHRSACKEGEVEVSETPGQCIQEFFAKRERGVTATHNAAGYVSMLAEAASFVVERFPNLQLEERRVIADTIREKAQRMSVLNRIDIHQFSAALGQVNRTLGITRT